MRYTLIYLLTTSILLGCSAKPDNSVQESLEQSIVDAKKANQPPSILLPSEVKDELLPDFLLREDEVSKEDIRFNVNAVNVDAKMFFNSLISDTNYNVIIDPNVAGEISINLKQVTFDETISAIVDIYGFDIKKKDNFIYIYPSTMRIENIDLNYLLLERNGYSKTTVSTGSIADSDEDSDSYSSSSSSSDDSGTTQGTEISSNTETNAWVELEHTLKTILGIGDDVSTAKGRMVVVSPQSGLVTLKAYPNEIREIKEFLERSEDRLQRQVMLEVKIIEVTLSDGYQQGIQWNELSSNNKGTDADLTTPNNIGGGFVSDAFQAVNDLTGLLTGGGSFTFRGNDGDSAFEVIVDLLKTQGTVNTLSNPRITASNNQKAMIKVGSEEYYVTDISSTDTTDINSSDTTQDVEITPFFSGVALDVTPQINDENEVQLHVHPSVTSVSEKIKNLGAEDYPLATSDVRETDTIVKAKSGEVIIIGGLMKTESKNFESKTPILGDLPAIGEMFTNRDEMTAKTELVILIKPTIIGRQTWEKELEKSKSLLKRWNEN